MSKRTVAPATSDWTRKVQELNTLLAQAEAELIDAETRLAELMAAINAFEFRLRLATRPLIQKIDAVQAEIDRLQQTLRDLFNGVRPRPQDENDAWQQDRERFVGAGAAGGEQFRYHEGQTDGPAQPAAVDEETAAQLKRLFRELARRFHPDLAASDAERAHRTDMMMQINAAYTARDLQALQKLLLTPDPAGSFVTDNDELRAQRLTLELAQVQRRLAEVQQELALLNKHNSARLMRRADRLARSGRDLLHEIADELRQKLSNGIAERDQLLDDIETFDPDSEEAVAERLATAVYELGLEEGLDDFEDDEEDELADEAWELRWQERPSWYDDEEEAF